VLYQEALKRGVVIYLPEISSGGRPELKRGTTTCRDPIKRSQYSAISWSDQGAFSGDMTAVSVKFLQAGKRWFDGRKINEGFVEEATSPSLGYLYSEENQSDESDEE